MGGCLREAALANAARAARTLLDERLIACANVIPAMLSLFDWNGERSEEREAGMLLKTDASLLQAAIDRLAGLHPYAQPAILGWRCEASTAPTLDWLAGLLN